MRRVRRERQPEAVRRPPLALRMAATFVVAAFLLGAVQFVRIEYAQRQRIETLRSEQQKIEAELEAVRQLARESEPVVVLEDGRGTRVIMDLESSIQQTSLRTYD
jgi:Tfp pilus assembly protein PilN